MLKRRLIATDQASVFIEMTSVNISLGLVLHQMTSDNNRSELGIHDHSNEPSSSKLVPKVVPLANKTATSRQELELLFHHQIAMLRTTGINPMIQPEPEDLPKDNLKLEIAVLRDAAYLQIQLQIAQKEEAGIQLNSEDGCCSDPVYDSDGSAEQYTLLLEPIPEPHQVQQNDSNVIYEVSNVEQGGGTVEQHPATVEETRAYFESLFNNLAIEVEKVNTVNRKLRKTNADLTTELARYKNQEKCFEISQEKYDELERFYQKSVYQEQCLTKKINALHLSSGKQITTLNEEFSNLNNKISKEKSSVSSLLEEKKS
ncbi:hypothetical protein Tco_0640689 [Tanacetum coccineum]